MQVRLNKNGWAMGTSAILRESVILTRTKIYASRDYMEAFWMSHRKKKHDFRKGIVRKKFTFDDETVTIVHLWRSSDYFEKFKKSEIWNELNIKADFEIITMPRMVREHLFSQRDSIFSSPYIPCVYQGRDLLHNKNEYEFLQDVVKKFKPELIVELGTYRGGLALALHDTVPNAEIHTFDSECNNEFEQDKITFHKLDVFRNSDIIIDLCKRPDRKVVYCDGGEKVKEAITFGPHLNKGDMLGVHDWGIWVHTEYDELDYIAKRFTSANDVVAFKKMLDNFEFYGSEGKVRLWLK
jgi:hypothetical protein